MGPLRPLLVTMGEGHVRGLGQQSPPGPWFRGNILFSTIKFFRRGFEGRTERGRKKEKKKNEGGEKGR